jgi:hypothetical protein
VTFPVNVQTRWLDFSPAFRWHTVRKIESSLQPFASRIRSVTVRITDADGDLVGRKCLIQVVMHPRGFFSASATGAGPYESAERAIARVRAVMHRRLPTEAETSGESRAA